MTSAALVQRLRRGLGRQWGKVRKLSEVPSVCAAYNWEGEYNGTGMEGKTGSGTLCVSSVILRGIFTPRSTARLRCKCRHRRVASGGDAGRGRECTSYSGGGKPSECDGEYPHGQRRALSDGLWRIYIRRRKCHREYVDPPAYVCAYTQ